MSTITASAGSAARSWTPTAGAGTRPSSRAPRAAAPPVARVPVRLTRRARLLVTLIAVVSLAVVLAVVVIGNSIAAAGTVTPVGHQRVTVAPGQTLWQIATRAKPGTDPRETIDDILRLNDLRTAEVQVGTALLLP